MTVKHTRISKRAFVVLFIILLSILAGTAFAANEKAIAEPPKEGTDKIEQEPTKLRKPYVYKPEGRIDPFRPFIEALVTREKQRPDMPLTPLQKYNIAQLELVGIIEGKKGPKALIQDSSNKGYIITKGTLIGPNMGKVIEITNDEVIIAEESVDVMGQKKQHTIVMKLHSADERKSE